MALTNGTKSKLAWAVAAAIFSSILTTAAFIATAATGYVETGDDESHWTQHMRVHTAEMQLQRESIEAFREDLRELKDILRQRFRSGG